MTSPSDSGFYHFFGIEASPFSIAPDPHYLYLGEKHQEALAHLFYGIGNEGGFIVLTGEVGTGKTTICRTILQQMPEGTDVAYIVNPRLTANELLQIICDELGLFYNSQERTNKVLLDILTKYLLASHSRGRHTLLIIDEAQNLSADVLEQIRLLTNLETDEKKLLQLVLIGQPELAQMLASRELRQLSQRVTARYHLQELSVREVGIYIDHRLRVAGFPGPLFTKAAVRGIYRHSRGTPRLINVLCERCMLGAYVTDSRRIDRRIVKRAIRELREPERCSRKGRQWRFAVPWAGLGRVALPVAALLLVAMGLNDAYSRRLSGVAGAAESTAPAAPTAAAEAPDGRDARREAALHGLAQRWRLALDPGVPVCSQLAAQALACLELELNVAQLQRLGLPVVIEAPAGEAVAFSLIDSERALQQLQDPGGPLRVTLFWRQPARGVGAGVPRPGDGGADADWLQQRLAWREGRDSYWSQPRTVSVAEPVRGRFGWLYARTLTLAPLGPSPGFDAAADEVIRALQVAWGWEATDRDELLTLVKLDHETNRAAPGLVRSG